MATITSDKPETQPATPDQLPTTAGPPGRRLDFRMVPGAARWLAGLAVVLVVLIVSLAIWGPGMDFPSEVKQQQTNGESIPVEISRLVSTEIKKGTTWMVRNWSWLFDGVDYSITYTMVKLEDSIKWVPWPATFTALAALAMIFGGWRLSLMVVLSLVFIGIMNRWDSSVETFAIMLFSVAMSIILAIPLGIIGARSNRVDAVMRPILDTMQTMPSYVYLVPGILFFGLGYTPAVIATVIYAVPPAIRLTNLGIRQVSSETVEAARSFGASPLQLLGKVQMPMALPTIMAGINQTTMLALSMVVIASLVGASGLGEDVFRALQRQDPGNSAIAGLSIVLIAIIFDRLTEAAARGRREALSSTS